MNGKATRVLLAAPLYPPQIGGPATHALLMETQLPRLGFVVRVVPFLSVLSLPKVLRHITYFFLVLRRAMGAHSIYALDPVSVGVPAYLASLLLGKRFVLRVGGDYAWEQGVARFGITETLDAYLARRNLPLRVRVLARMQAFVATRAAKVVVPSLYLGSVAKKWGVKEERIVLARSVPTALPRISREDARKELGIPDESFVIFSAGRLMPWKGFEVLIKASSAVCKDASATLVIAGSGPQQKAIEQAIEGHKMSAHVRMLGIQSRERMARWLAAADLFVLNTGYEGFSHQILEAMRMGLPVLTTSIGGNMELIEHDVSGVLVPYNDERRLTEALARLKDDPELRGRLAAAGIKRAELFTETDSISAIARALRPQP